MQDQKPIALFSPPHLKIKIKKKPPPIKKKYRTAIQPQPSINKHITTRTNKTHNKKNKQNTPLSKHNQATTSKANQKKTLFSIAPPQLFMFYPQVFQQKGMNLYGQKEQNCKKRAAH